MGFNYDEEGILADYIRTHETVRVEPGGKTYKGESTGEIFDLNWQVIMPITGESYATRIDAK